MGGEKRARDSLGMVFVCKKCTLAYYFGSLCIIAIVWLCLSIPKLNPYTTEPAAIKSRNSTTKTIRVTPILTSPHYLHYDDQFGRETNGLVQVESRNSTSGTERVSATVHPYLISLNYDDQLGGAIRGLVQLVNTTVHWNRRPVEPFVAGSNYVAVPSTANLQRIYTFHEFYNLSSVEVQLSKCFSHATSFSTFEEFLSNSTREFVLLHFWKGRKRDVSSSAIKDCTNAQNKATKKAETRLNNHLTKTKNKLIAKYGENYLFKGIKAVCVDASGFLMQEVEKAVTGDRPRSEQLTVVVTSWRYTKNVPDNYYFHDPSSRGLEKCDVYKFPHSALVLQSAEEFRKLLGLPTQYFGLHIRIEWLTLDNAKKPGYMEKCLETAHAVFKALMRKYNMSSKSVVALNDYSNYGSNSVSCKVGSQSPCDQKRKKMVDRLASWGIKTVAYDPASFGRPLHRGFVSLVEKEFLSSAKYLLAIGGGLYQASIQSMFVNKHDNKHLFAVCQRSHADVIPNLEI